MQSFIDKRTSLQGFLGVRQTVSKDTGFAGADSSKKVKQMSVGPAASATGSRLGGFTPNLPAGGTDTNHPPPTSHFDIEGKRSSYQFNRHQQTRPSPQTEKRVSNQPRAATLPKESKRSPEKQDGSQ